jgi:GntR family transcriptional regulator/MocR family aminotransferase
MAEFLAQGHFGRHVKKMRSAYQARRSALIAALTASFGNRFVIQPEAGGLSLLLTPSGGEDVQRLEAAALARDMRPLAVPVDDRSPDKLGGLLLGFANTPESEAAAVVERLAAAFAEVP